MYIFLASNTNYIVFGLTWTGIRPIVFVIWCIHVSQYTIMAVWRNIVENLSKVTVFYSHCCGVRVTHLYWFLLLLLFGLSSLFVLCPMLSVYLTFPFSIDPSVYSSVYLVMFVFILFIICMLNNIFSVLYISIALCFHIFISNCVLQHKFVFKN